MLVLNGKGEVKDGGSIGNDRENKENIGKLLKKLVR